MPTISDAIAKAQLLGNDTPTSHRVFPDALQSQVDQVRTLFVLSNKNIVVPGTHYVVDGGALSNGDALVTSAANGLVTMLTAPQKSLDWFYYYQNFLSSEIQDFVDDGLAQVGMTEVDLPLIDPTLYDVVTHFAAAHMNEVMAQRFAANYNVSIEGESFEKSAVYQAYLKSAESLYKEAVDKREEYYKRQGRRFVAASQVITQPYPPNNLLPRR
jgi:hypothetical protein